MWTRILFLHHASLLHGAFSLCGRIAGDTIPPHIAPDNDEIYVIVNVTDEEPLEGMRRKQS